MDILNTKIKSILTEKNTKIKPENIKKDVNILGITGTYEGGEQVVLPDGISFSGSSSSNMDWLANVDTSNLTVLDSSFYGNTQLLDAPLFDTSNVTSMSSTFSSCNNLRSVPLYDTSKVTNMYGMFYNDTVFVSVPLFDTSKVTNMSAMFRYCYEITSIPQFNTSSLELMANMFNGCSKLTTVPVLDTSKVTNWQNAFSGCTRLTNESLNNILLMCANAIAYRGTKTLKYIGLSSTQATTCTGLSNWASAQSAGWTTGY